MAVLAVLVVALGCSAEPIADGPDAGDPAAVELRGACPLAERLGGFVVEAQAEYSIVDGKIADGVLPISVLEETMVSGDCRLLRRNNPFCDPPCAPGMTCDLGGSCVVQPEQQDVGEVSIDGMNKAVHMKPLSPGNNYFDTVLPHPVFAPGAVVHMHSTEGRYGRLSLFGIGSEPLRILGDRWVIDEAEALTVRWEPPTVAMVRTSVWLQLSIDQHGTSPLRVVCDFADTGEGVIPADLTKAMIDAGVSGFPNGGLSRETVDKQLVSDGCVDFHVASPRQHTVRVQGHTPCNNSSMCPDGQICDQGTQTCVDE